MKLVSKYTKMCPKFENSNHLPTALRLLVDIFYLVERHTE